MEELALDIVEVGIDGGVADDEKIQEPLLELLVEADVVAADLDELLESADEIVLDTGEADLDVEVD